jgi:hypothetical protein
MSSTEPMRDRWPAGPRGCRGRKTKGAPCGAIAGAGGYCTAHRPGGLERMRELGRKGGLRSPKRELAEAARWVAHDELQQLAVDACIRVVSDRRARPSEINTALWRLDQLLAGRLVSRSMPGEGACGGT